MNTNNRQSAAKPLSVKTYEERSTTIETALAKEKGVEYTQVSGNGENSKIVYIYALDCPKSKQIRYVGKSVEPSKRYLNHLSETNNTYKSKWINSLLKEELKPLFMTLDVCEESEWIFWEQYWISQCKSWGFNLTNYTSGGEGYSGNKLSVEHRINISKGLKGRKISEETKLKISIGNKGKKKKPEHIENLKNSHKGKAPVTKKRFTRKIVQIEEDKVIKIWDSIKEAAIFYNVNQSSISHCCSGRKKTIKGYTWKYFKS